MQGNLFVSVKVALLALFEVLFEVCPVSFVQLVINVEMNHAQCFLTIQISTSAYLIC